MKFPKIKGCKFHLVGGCVRDTVMKKPFNDYDYVVETELPFNTLQYIINQMDNSRVYLAKEEFLTIRCRIDGQDCDIAYPRKDSDYTDGRHPDKVDHVGTLKEDASRRDFKMNAMYMDESKTIYDPFNGMSDITNKIISTVGSPRTRFKEDYLRVLRAIRFSIQCGFKIEDKTQYEMLFAAYRLRKISMERIKDELNKCFRINASRTVACIGAFDLWHILDYHKLNLELTNRKIK